MQCPYIDESIDFLEGESGPGVYFQTNFTGYMEMYSDAQTVADYLKEHGGWFRRCAEPMKTLPLGDNGYILTVGQYGAFGYQVEPKMAVVLQPPAAEGIYYMHSIPVPDESPTGYQVNYQATMELEEVVRKLAPEGAQKEEITPVITKVNWQLQMSVMVNFPQLIYKLPLSLIQQTGDRLLSQIVRQISPRLTYKVQQDFHQRFNLPIPPKTSRQLLALK